MFNTFITQPFLKTIETRGEQNALYIQNKFYSYTDLAKSISKIRKYLQTINLKSKNVGIVANDDIETYGSIIAVWLEGLAYVPLNPKHPAERALEVVNQANIELVLNSEDINFLTIPTLLTQQLQFEELVLEPKLFSDDLLAYLIFTSGSTGKPKGVPITRGNFGTFVDSFSASGFKIEASDRCIQYSNLTFDMSMQTFMIPLIKGACIYTIPENQIKYSYAYELVEEQKITVGAFPPSMLRYLKPYFEELHFPDMKFCIITAEASPIELIDEWANCIPNAEIFNFYGPTETTIYCTYIKYNRNKINKNLNGIWCIGKPMKGTETIIIDSEKNVLGINQKGELCISGNQLTPGYLNNPQKNAVSFFEKEINGKHIRFYKTGDSCFVDEDGDIFIEGRLDFQMKIQGHLVEPGEIEYHTRNFLKGNNAVALFFKNIVGIDEIALFVEDALTDTSVILKHIKSQLPDYMLPSKIIALEKFPINVNGKVDRTELRRKLQDDIILQNDKSVS